MPAREIEDRAQLLRVMRDLLGVRYVEPSRWPAAGCRPVELDCSVAVAHACNRIFQDPEWFCRFPGGAGWSPSAYQLFTLDLADRATDDPHPGDLAFYSRPNLHHQGGSGRDAFWHVMMATEAFGVIGACDVAGCVREYSSVSYTDRWTFRGFKRVPMTRQWRDPTSSATKNAVLPEK